jgi:hypothetical protein
VLGIFVADRVGSFPASDNITSTHVLYLIVLGAVSSLVAGAAGAWTLQTMPPRQEGTAQGETPPGETPPQAAIEAAPEERA